MPIALPTVVPITNDEPIRDAYLPGERGIDVARRMSRLLRVFHYAVSLGHLIYYLPTVGLLRSSFRLTDRQEADYRQFAGDGVFRV